MVDVPTSYTTASKSFFCYTSDVKKFIYLVRHAESKTNVDPFFEGEDVLSESGEIQATSIAPRFKHQKIEQIYTSKILRARLTADEISKVTGTSPVIQDFLGERKGAFSDDSKYSYTESFDALKARMESARELLEAENDIRHIVVISHSIFLRSLAAYLMLGDLLTEELLLRIEDSLVMDNTGISKLVFDIESRKWRILSWNDLAHLME